MTIQPLTHAIGLVESDDSMNDQNNVTKVQSNGKPRIMKQKSHEDLFEEHAVEPERKSSGKTNSHILSDYENSVNSTPHHVAKEKDAISIEYSSVREEIAQIQSAIESVKKEMEEMQQKSEKNTPMHSLKVSSRPPSSTSNKTFVFDHDTVDYEGEPIKIEEVVKVATPKRIMTPVSDARIDDHPHFVTIENDVNNETEQDETTEEIVHSEPIPEFKLVDPMVMIRSDSAIRLSRASNVGYENEEDEITESSYQEVNESPEISISIPTPVKDHRSPYLRKNQQKTMHVKNLMPNLNQPSTVVIHAPKGNAVFPLSLRRFERPKDAMHTCLSQLESSNWEDVMEGLKNFVRLIRHHAVYIDPQVHLFTIALAKQVKNLRSQVSRAACSASGEFFMTHAKVLDGDAEELAAALLNRTADTNKFLRADAFKGKILFYTIFCYLNNCFFQQHSSQCAIHCTRVNQ